MKKINGTGEQVAEEFAPFTWAGYDPAACAHTRAIANCPFFRNQNKKLRYYAKVKEDERRVSDERE